MERDIGRIYVMEICEGYIGGRYGRNTWEGNMRGIYGSFILERDMGY